MDRLATESALEWIDLNKAFECGQLSRHNLHPLIGSFILDAQTLENLIGAPFAPIGNTNVQRIDTFAFYYFGKGFHDLRLLKEGDSLANPEVSRKIIAASIWILLFFEPASGAIILPHTKAIVAALKAFLEERQTRAREGKDESEREEAKILDNFFIQNLNGHLDEFDRFFSRESKAANVFAVTKKGIYETDSLIENAVSSLSPEIVARLSSDAIQNINAAGRCLALESPTACGFHMLRAVESLMREYHLKLTGTALAVKNRNWGAFIKVLDKSGADPKVTGFLTHIKDFYRNPIVHPEESLDSKEAFSLFTASLSAITMLDAAIKTP